MKLVKYFKKAVTFFFIIGLFFLSSSPALEGKIFKGRSDKKEVEKLFGKPDLITTRNDMMKLILPGKELPARYKNIYEIWIYYRKKGTNRPWGFVEFDAYGIVVDINLHTPTDFPKYKVYPRELSYKIFKEKGNINGEDWLLMPDKSKLLFVIDIINSLEEEGVMLRKTPLYYLEQIDSFYQDRSHIKFSVVNTMYCIAVLSKDWDDGTDKEERIRKLLPLDHWKNFLSP